MRDPRASYRKSLKVLKSIKELKPAMFTKSSIMVGIGETWEDLKQTFEDLSRIDVDFLTIGQYLRPSRKHMAVDKYIHPDVFKDLESLALSYNFKYVASGPLVRSSYKAGEFFIESIINKSKS